MFKTQRIKPLAGYLLNDIQAIKLHKFFPKWVVSHVIATCEVLDSFWKSKTFNSLQQIELISSSLLSYEK